MDLRQLRYFVRIVELESITAAAETLHIAQPSLSQHVANLEKELETPLLLRGPGGVRATEAGKLLYRHAKVMLRQAEEARSAIKHGRDTPSGHVKVGLPTSTSRILALPLIEAVASRYPEVVLEVVEGSSSDLATAVSMHRLDLSVAMDARPQPARMTIAPLLTEDLFLVGPPLGVDAVTLRQMSALPLVLPSFPNSIRVLAARTFAEEDLPLRLVVETSAVSVLLTVVRAGKGWTVLPSSALVGPEARSDNIVATRIASADFRRRVSVCMSVSTEKSVACTHVHQTLIEVAAGLVAQGCWTGVQWQGERPLPAIPPAEPVQST
ncbi:LysR family transcriptional regulator [Bordetella genomosp. 10]|uniref:LysR family transcriptional regulator n=1 Tax=Bordetella genomosp. 10 TaxID=1416804 RepID=A0A261SDZ2_9BORD|nr:LysR substrate-binding domain-containing protein [Bordetella genomosp. 10]OZI34593.1 LysR family transcriptional regulator [Bordetella genomosp. 10]